MLVGHVKIMDDTKRDIATFVRFHTFDQGDYVGASVGNFTLTNYTWRIDHGRAEWEINFCRALAIYSDKIADEQIQRSAKIMNKVANKHG